MFQTCKDGLSSVNILRDAQFICKCCVCALVNVQHITFAQLHAGLTTSQTNMTRNNNYTAKTYRFIRFIVWGLHVNLVVGICFDCFV